MPLFQKAVFLTTVAKLSDLPVDALREVAFAGRSNAGKSSAINTLAAHTRLAFVSKTPGRTQHLNYFQVQAGRYFVDLPGYGYAKTPVSVRRQWDGLIGPYMETRRELVGLVLIMDSRHPLTDLDCQLIEWFASTGRPIHILLSKADKLNRQEQALTLRGVRERLVEFGELISVQLFSSLKKTGIEDAEKVLAAWLDLQPEPVKVKPPPPRDRSIKRNPGGKAPKPASAQSPALEGGGADSEPPGVTEA